MIICGFLYLFCLFRTMGMPLGVKETGENANKESAKGESIEDAVEYVASSMITEAPKIALTFDDGPSSECTGRLLDGLKERNVKVTFFLIGENAKNAPDLVKREYEEGHLIGNHTYHHVEITKVSDEKAKEEIGSLAKSDEDVLSYIAFPVQAEAFLKERAEKEKHTYQYTIKQI